MNASNMCQLNMGFEREIYAVKAAYILHNSSLTPVITYEVGARHNNAQV